MPKRHVNRPNMEHVVAYLHEAERNGSSNATKLWKNLVRHNGSTDLAIFHLEALQDEVPQIFRKHHETHENLRDYLFHGKGE